MALTRHEARSGPVRVLQILTCDALGGTELMLAALIERLDRDAVTTTVASLDAPGPIAARLRDHGVVVWCLGGRGLGVAFVRLARILRHREFDVVNAYGFKSTFVARFLVRLFAPRASFVSGVRGLHVTETDSIKSPKARMALWLDRRTARLVNVYDANSEGALELLAMVGVPPERLHYIPNGLDVNRWAVSSGERPRPPRILCVARFVPRKRQEDLLRASALLGAAGVEHTLVLAGSGQTRTRLEQLVAELGIGHTTTLTGRVDPDEVRALLASATIFCLPSTWEGMAGTVMEAMASGVPVVGTAVNGIADLVQDGITGILVPPLSPPALAQALRRLIDDPQLAATMGAHGRVRIQERFSLDRTAADKQALYVRMASRT